MMVPTQVRSSASIVEPPIGTVIAAYVANWIASIPVLDALDVGRLLDEAGPLPRDVIGVLWSAYRDASADPPALRRVAEFVGVRLIQSAVELTQDANEITTKAKLIATVGENMLLAPELAARSLLGLEA